MTAPTAMLDEPAAAASLAAPARIPMWLKLAYTAFMAVLIPVYWMNYGAANFLFYCDVALIVTLIGIWREDPLLVSMPAVGILALQSIWVADYVAQMFGLTITGATSYMFDSSKSAFLRGLSLFHGWLPFLLAYLVWRLGYDRRAFKSWTLLAWGLMLTSYFFLPGPMPNPGNAAVNINYVHGLSDTAAQTWMHPLLWLAMMMTVLPGLLFAPTHWLLTRWRGLPRQAA